MVYVISLFKMNVYFKFKIQKNFYVEKKKKIKSLRDE